MLRPALVLSAALSLSALSCVVVLPALAQSPANAIDKVTQLSRQADAQYKAGNLRAAVNTYSKAILLARDQNDDRAFAYNKLQQGSMLMYIGRYEEAMTGFDESEVIYRRLGDELGIADISRVRGDTYTNLGEFSKSVECLTESILIYRKYNDKPKLVSAYNRLGRSFIFNSLPHMAIPILLEGERVYPHLHIKFH